MIPNDIYRRWRSGEAPPRSGFWGPNWAFVPAILLLVATFTAYRIYTDPPTDPRAHYPAGTVKKLEKPTDRGTVVFEGTVDGKPAVVREISD